jgi:hypothetical protein
MRYSFGLILLTCAVGVAFAAAMDMGAKGMAVHPAQGNALAVTHKSMTVACPGGTLDSSPAVHCWGYGQSGDCASRRDARTQHLITRYLSSLRDELTFSQIPAPAINRWAIVKRPYGSKSHGLVCNSEGVALGWMNNRAFGPQLPIISERKQSISCSRLCASPVTN